ncbi:MAG: Uma2 family endonuclease [Timaviella obliquedivisa GSE-PSE-MK23-08B]|jgi:Uma2 family endonuclease|nr:Uma2 family endonuclease [Timaviella obliquedivisa GSE-PSE-MK23-08B]
MTQTPLQSQQPALIPAKITLEQYHRIVEAGILDNCRVELLNGVIVEMSPEGTPHASDSSRAGEFLVRLLGEQAHVRFAKPITLPNGSEPEPDLAIAERVEDYYRSHHPYPEDIFWVIEYSNTSLEKDLNIKADIYAEVNIREYWVVNLKDMKLIVFRDPLNGKYQSQQVMSESHIQPLAFPNVLIPVHQLLR